jgi:hypothetical protein
VSEWLGNTDSEDYADPTAQKRNMDEQDGQDGSKKELILSILFIYVQVLFYGLMAPNEAFE